MTAVPTHKGGPFYDWYVSVYGYAPPATVDSNATRYLAWQQGLSKTLAELIPYGSMGPPGVALAGGAVVAPVEVTTPSAPAPAPAPLAAVLETGTVVVAPVAPAPAPAPVEASTSPVATAASGGITVGGKDYSASQVQAMQDVYNECVAKKANQRAMIIMFTIGTAENEWDAYTCNLTDHCGVFQLDSDWQKEQSFQDTSYWAAYALDNGFYSHGGVIAIERNYRSESIGWCVEACQGAGPTWDDATAYYNTRVAEASALLAKFIGTQPTAGGGSNQPATNAPSVPQPSTGGVFNLFDALNWAGDFENLFKYMVGGADEAAAMADRYKTNRVDKLTVIGWQ